jgi:hypothetical protein
LSHLPAGWNERAFSQTYGDKLKVIVPAVADLLAPKRMRNEARDREHEAFAVRLGLI